MISHENSESVQRMKIRAREIFLWEKNSRASGEDAPAVFP